MKRRLHLFRNQFNDIQTRTRGVFHYATKDNPDDLYKIKPIKVQSINDELEDKMFLGFFGDYPIFVRQDFPVEIVTHPSRVLTYQPEVI